MTIQSLLQSILIQKMAYKTNRATQDEQTIQTSTSDQVISFLLAKSTASAQHIYKANCNAAIYIQNQVGFLAGGYLFNLQRKLKRLALVMHYVVKVSKLRRCLPSAQYSQGSDRRRTS